MGGLQAAAGAAEGEHKAAIVLTVSVLFSCAVGVLLTLTGGLITLPLAGIVLYQAAWCVLALVFPLMHCAYHGRGRLAFYMTLCSIHLPLIKRAIKQMSRQSQSMNMPSQTPASPRWNCSTKT